MEEMKKVRHAVALVYDKNVDNAPRVVAKGTGKIAERIVETAEANRIPVREDAELAQALRFLDTGDMIPVELYRSEERRVGKECRYRWSRVH